MPKRFAFALQPLLERRKHVEEVARAVVAGYLQTHREACAELDAIDRQMQLALARKTSGAELLAIAHSLETQTQTVAEREAALDEARRQLTAAGKGREVLELLKRRRIEEFALRRRRAENHELEEANARRPAHRRPGH